MKKTVKFFLTGMFLMFFFGNSFAQDNSTATTASTKPTIEQQTATLVAEMTTVATLSTEQADKITPFVTEFFAQGEKDKTEYVDSKEKQMVSARERKANLITNLKTVLTVEQLNTLEQFYANKEKENKKTDTEIKPTE